ncbi:MAG: hypothetical protein ABSF25_22585 [Bryobacteraceae bacterium]
MRIEMVYRLGIGSTMLAVVLAAWGLAASQPPAQKAAAQKGAVQKAAPPPAPAPAPVPEDLPLVRNGRDTPFSAAPEASFRILVGSAATELKLAFEVAPKGAVNVFLQPERGVAETSDPPEQLVGGATGSTSFVVAQSSTPPLRSGAYRLRLESAVSAGGFFSIFETVPAQRSQPPALLDLLKTPPAWLEAALSVAALACLGLMFVVVPRPAKRVLIQVHESVSSLAQLLAETKTAVDRLPQAISKAAPAPPQPQGALQPKPAATLPPRLERLLSADPMLVVARLIRDVAARSGAEMEAQTTRSFPAYLQALERAERLRATAPREPAEECGAEWDTLNRAIGALQTRHNPRFFLDWIVEAGRLRMAEKDQLLAVLGIEEIVPAAGAELSSLDGYNVEHSAGAGNRCILERVLANGYRSRENGEVFRKPAIAVRLVSDAASHF